MYFYKKLSQHQGLSGTRRVPRRRSVIAPTLAAPRKDMRYGPPPDSGQQYQPTAEHPFARVIVFFSDLITGADLHCVCYEDMPRGEAREVGVMHAEELEYTETPYALEVHPVGHSYVCDCRVVTNTGRCPESVHQGAALTDPWRIRQCNEWVDETKERVANIIGSKLFRERLAQRVFKTSGLQSWRGIFLRPAEFTQVLVEREERAKPLKVIAPLIIAAAGSVIIWKFIRTAKEGEK